MKQISRIDVAIVLLIYLMIVIFGFFGWQSFINKIIIILIIARLFVKFGKKGLKKIDFIYGFVILILIIINALLLNGLANFKNYGTDNIIVIVYSMIYALYFYELTKYYRRTLDYIFEKCNYIINVTMIANMAAIIYQIKNPGQLIAKTTTSYTDDVMASMLQIGDTASGFFAFAGVHTLCIFSTFVILYDLSGIKTIRNRSKKVIAYIYLALIMLLNTVVSLLNDNKAFFILLPVAMCIYGFIGYNPSRNYIRSVILTIIVIMILFVIIAFMDTSIISSINNIFMQMIDFTNKVLNTGQANGSNERIAIPLYALKLISTWLLGKGIATINMYHEGYLGFNHFGQSDMGTFLILLGIWFTILLLTYFIRLYSKMIVSQFIDNKYMIYILIAILFIIMTVFTQIITNYNNQIVFIFIVLVFRMHYIKTRKEFIRKI